MTVSPKIDGQNLESCLLERFGLRLPALLVESASVGQHNRPIALAVQVAVDQPSITRSKGNVLLRASTYTQQQRRED
jgi:hypothetical protein